MSLKLLNNVCFAFWPIVLLPLGYWHYTAESSVRPSVRLSVILQLHFVAKRYILQRKRLNK